MPAISDRQGLQPGPIRLQVVGRVALGGFAGLIAWEAFARLIAPFWIGGPLDPTGLIEMTLGLGGLAAQALHLLTGLVFYPVGYALVCRPLAARFVPGLPWWGLAVGYGVALWVFAMFVMASLVGGMPPFLGFEPVAWASLAGHLALALALAAVLARGGT